MFKLINMFLDAMLENFFEGTVIEPEADTELSAKAFILRHYS